MLLSKNLCACEENVDSADQHVLQTYMKYVLRHLPEPSVFYGQRIDVMSCMQYKLSIFFEEENWVPVNFRSAIQWREDLEIWRRLFCYCGSSSRPFSPKPK